MILHLLPTRTAGAAENMALDFLLLQRYPQPAVSRFRHYEWRGPAFTFGYAQKLASVREQLAAAAVAPEALDLCRRPTGGGIVDHREDWTYALVIPRGHPLEDARATESYRQIHEALAEALRAQGVAARTQPAVPADGAPAAGVCFQRAEIHDVVRADGGGKIAGAAQKRNKHGLLLQGSIWRPAAPGVEWERFQDDFTVRIAALLGSSGVAQSWPELNEDEVSGLTDQYASAEWIELR